LEVVRVRQTLEEYCLEQAIVHGEEEDVKRLGAIVKAMERRAAHGASMEAEDREFHRHLANMANARLALMILEIFWDLRGKLPVDNSPEALKRRYLRHYRIYQAVKMRDLQLGRVDLGEHFSGSYEELLPSLDPERGAALGPEDAATTDASQNTCQLCSRVDRLDACKSGTLSVLHAEPGNLMDKGGDVNLELIDRLAEPLVADGVKGAAVCGTAGESLSL